MIELESNIVLSLVDQPSLIQTSEVKPEWFNNQRLAKLVKFLNDTHGDFKGFAPLRAAFNQAYPNTISDDGWTNLANAQSYRYEFNGYLKDLKQRYLQTRLVSATTRYTFQKSPEAFKELKQRMADIDEPSKAPQTDLKAAGEQLIHDLDNPVKPGIKTFGMIDNYTHNGLRGGNLFTIGARPSVGKSALAINIIYRTIANNNDMTIDLFSLEMPQIEIYKRLMSIHTGINQKLLYNPSRQLNEHQKQEIRDGVETFNHTGLQIYDNALSLETITRTIRQRAASARKDHYLAVIDYLQLIASSRFQNDRQHQVELVSRQIKLLTNELNIPIILLSQLSRGIENRQDKTPVLSDLRESGSIEQDSNMVAFLYREEASGAAESQENLVFDVQKNREGSLGRNKLRFNKPIQYMAEVYPS